MRGVLRSNLEGTEVRPKDGGTEDGTREEDMRFDYPIGDPSTGRGFKIADGWA